MSECAVQHVVDRVDDARNHHGDRCRARLHAGTEREVLPVTAIVPAVAVAVVPACVVIAVAVL
ncbi:MAG TPA: hypothetical protein VFV63_07960, partial [Ilumatobacteraceae bacterium]|nr:hypothetical protein [Ilumatobacteraceae bacterium]